MSASVRRQTKLVMLGGVNRTRKIDCFRRHAWVPNRVTLRSVEQSVGPCQERTYIPGEFPEPPKSKTLALIRRGFGLLSDAVVLLIFSPFFVVWFLYRVVARLMRGNN